MSVILEEQSSPNPKSPRSSKVIEVGKLFLRLGFTAFGGLAAHIGMMHDETVLRRKWLSDQEFLDLVGATNQNSGPNSTEMPIHLGYLRAGWRGMIIAGTSFFLLAMQNAVHSIFFTPDVKIPAKKQLLDSVMGIWMAPRIAVGWEPTLSLDGSTLYFVHHYYDLSL